MSKFGTYSSATTPVAGTEVLIVLQSSATKKITITNLLGADLAALVANASNGLWARTASGTGSARTLTGTAAEITVTNGDGVSGNPTFSLSAALTFTGKTVTGGTFTGGAFNGTVGATTPAAGTFTDLTANGNTTLGDAPGDTVLVNAKSATRPNMPAFMAYLAADTSADKTGDGTSYTIVFDSEYYDRGSDFATGIFTVPTTGLYQLTLHVTLSGVLAAHNQFVAFLLIGSADDPYSYAGDLTPDVQGLASIHLTGTFLLTAGQTVTPNVVVAGSTKVIGIKANIGAGTYLSWFSGHQVG